MTTTTHTTGPWHLANRTEIHDRLAQYDADGARVGDTPNCIATVKYPYASLEGREANARLMAAAPAMRDGIEATEIALTNVLQLFGEQALADGARAKIQITRDRLRALLAQIDGEAA